MFQLLHFAATSMTLVRSLISFQAREDGRGHPSVRPFPKDTACPVSRSFCLCRIRAFYLDPPSPCREASHLRNHMRITLPRPLHLSTLAYPHILDRLLSYSSSISTCSPYILNLPNCLHTFAVVNHLSEHDVFAVKVGCWSTSNEELTSIRVRSGVGHGK